MIRRFGARVLMLLAACTLPGAVTQAEVSAVYEPGVTIQPHGLLVQSIIEDGDPVTSAWARHSPLLSTRRLLNEAGAGGGDGVPSALYNPVSKLPIVVWGRYDGSAYDLVESHFVDGDWTAPAVIAAGVVNTMDPEPSIALDPQTGDMHVVYFANDAAPRVLHTSAPPDLSSWTAPIDVSQLGEIAMRPHAVIHQGVLTVAYESHGSAAGSTPRQIVVATSDGLGGFWHDTVSSTHFVPPNRPRLHTGTGVSLWIDWIDEADGMAWAGWHPATGWSGVLLEPFGDLEDLEYHVRGRIEALVDP